MRKWIHEGREQRYSDAFSGHTLFVWNTGAYATESLVVAAKKANWKTPIIAAVSRKPSWMRCRQCA